MCVPHLNGAVSFLFFNLFVTSFVRFAVASTHRRDGAFVVFICICICICICFYLYLYLYLRWWMHVMGVAYKGSFWWDLGCVRYWDLLIELVARQSTPWNDDYDYPPPPSPGSYFFSLIIFSSADPNPTLFLFLF